MQDLQNKYELDYTKSVTPKDNEVMKFQFNSYDFHPNGTYMYLGDGQKFAKKIKQNFNHFA